MQNPEYVSVGSNVRLSARNRKLFKCAKCSVVRYEMGPTRIQILFASKLITHCESATFDRQIVRPEDPVRDANSAVCTHYLWSTKVHRNGETSRPRNHCVAENHKF